MSAHSVMAEQQVLGQALLTPRLIAEVQLLVAREDFFRPAHTELFDLLVELHENGVDKIDAMVVMQELTSRGRLPKVGGAPYIAGLVQGAGAGNVSYYAMRVRELSRVRRWRQIVERSLQVVEETERGYWNEDNQQGATDLERLMDSMAKFSIESELLLDEKMADEAIPGLMRYSDFLAIPDSPQDWVVEQLFGKQDVWMFLAGEGGGKSYLSRQLVNCIGAGVHPFDMDRQITPQTALLVDLENADAMIRRQSRGIHLQANLHGDPQQHNEHTWIWTRQQGLNLRERSDQLLFESVLARVNPKFVALGSLYNSFSKGRDDWETAAEDVKNFFNRMRARYGFCLCLEHHMPKGDGKDRPQTPYGSSVWMRWVTHGRVLEPLLDNLWRWAQSFRNDRDPRETPAGLTRGGSLSWSPVWSRADMEAMVEQAEMDDELQGRANQLRHRAAAGNR